MSNLDKVEADRIVRMTTLLGTFTPFQLARQIVTYEDDAKRSRMCILLAGAKDRAAVVEMITGMYPNAKRCNKSWPLIYDILKSRWSIHGCSWIKTRIWKIWDARMAKGDLQ